MQMLNFSLLLMWTRNGRQKNTQLAQGWVNQQLNVGELMLSLKSLVHEILISSQCIKKPELLYKAEDRK